jgi:hypothetical protein
MEMDLPTPLPKSIIHRQEDALSKPLMEEMSIYALKMSTKEMMQHYLKRILLEKPADPLAFLIQEIKSSPYEVPPVPEDEDERPEEEKAKFLDLRRDETKMDMLRDLFDRYDPKKTGVVARAQVLVAFQTTAVLLKSFPKHATSLCTALERMNCGNKEGSLTFECFSAGLMEALQAPGLP